MVPAVPRAEGGDQNRGDFYVPPGPVNACSPAPLPSNPPSSPPALNMPVGSSLLCLARKTLANVEAEDTKSQRSLIRAAGTLVRHERLVGFDRNHPIRGGESRRRNLRRQLEILGRLLRSSVPDLRRGWSRVAARRNSVTAIHQQVVSVRSLPAGLTNVCACPVVHLQRRCKLLAVFDLVPSCVLDEKDVRR